MGILQTDSSVMEKTLHLCEAITEDQDFKEMHKNVEDFLADQEAREAYKGVHEKGAELQDKKRIGVELTAQEMTDFELAREELLQNKKVTAFMDAQQKLQGIQSSINSYLGLTIELGRVPTDEELTAANSGGGCCGGSGGGGCGC